MALHYFDFLTNDQIVSACKLGMVRQFEPLETIYYEDKGHVSYVHFVISGECMILQCLKMKATHRNGVKFFDLVDIGKDQDVMFQDLTSVDLLKKLKEGEIAQSNTNYNLISQIDTSSEEILNDAAATKKPVRKMDIKTIEIACGMRKPSVEAIPTTQENASTHSVVATNLDETKPTELNENANEDLENIGNLENPEVTELENVEKGTAPDDILAGKDEGEKVADLKSRVNILDVEVMKKKTSAENIEPSENAQLQSEISFSKLTLIQPENIDDDDDESVVNPSRHSIVSDPEPAKKSSEVTILPKRDVFTRIENHFMDVGSMNFGGIFGLGEKLEHRVIMARTTVQCLMLPRFWLLEKEQNPGNVWQRRRFYLDTTIPSRDTLFMDFLTTRKWQKFKHDFIQNSISPNSIGNPTKVQDIPVICRIVEANDD